MADNTAVFRANGSNKVFNDLRLQLSDDLLALLEKINNASLSYIKEVEEIAKKLPALVKATLPELIKRRNNTISKLRNSSELFTSQQMEASLQQLSQQLKALEHLTSTISTLTAINIYTQDVANLLEQDPLNSESAESFPPENALEDTFAEEQTFDNQSVEAILAIEAADNVDETDDEAADEELAGKNAEIDQTAEAQEINLPENSLLEIDLQEISFEDVLVDEQLFETAEVELLENEPAELNTPDMLDEQTSADNELNDEKDDYEDEEDYDDEEDELEDEEDLEAENELEDELADEDNLKNDFEATEDQLAGTADVQSIQLSEDAASEVIVDTFIEITQEDKADKLTITAKVYSASNTNNIGFWRSILAANNLAVTEEETLINKPITSPSA